MHDPGVNVLEFCAIHVSVFLAEPQWLRDGIFEILCSPQ